MLIVGIILLICVCIYRTKKTHDKAARAAHYLDLYCEYEEKGEWVDIKALNQEVDAAWLISSFEMTQRLAHAPKEIRGKCMQIMKSAKEHGWNGK